jgi:cyclopropane fatty-acyl-phospholipid synthase-like methyltransferase
MAIARRISHLASYASRSAFCGIRNAQKFMFSSNAAHNKKDLEQEIATYYGASNTNTAYETCWGQSNIHLGYFPHLENKNATQLTFLEAATELTKRMGIVANINKHSRVIDFGCGFGGPASELVQYFGCQVTGLDLTPEHIEKCQKLAKKLNYNESQLNFVTGSFTDLPTSIKQKKFTHVYSQLAIYHVAPYLQEVIDSAHEILEDGGNLVLCDFTACESGPSPQATEHFYKRLHLDLLISPAQYVEKLTKSGFNVVFYEQVDNHCAFGYELLEKQARQHGFKSADGAMLADNYKNTSEVIQGGEVGMNIVVAKKR